MTRKFILLALLLGAVTVANAQYINLYLTDSSSQSYALADVSNITFSGSEMQMNFLGGSSIDWNTSIINYMDYEDSGLGIFEPTKDLLTEFKVYPNPSNGVVFVRLKSDIERSISIDVYNIHGQHIRNLFHGNSGQSILLEWNAQDNSGNKMDSGVYFCAVAIGSQIISRTIILVNQ